MMHRIRAMAKESIKNATERFSKKKLMEREPRPREEQDRLDSRLLLCARDLHDIRMIKDCLKAGASINATDRWKMTALMWSAMNGNMKICQLLVKRGADINAKDDRGFTALHYARNSRHNDLAKFLEDNGARM